MYLWIGVRLLEQVLQVPQQLPLLPLLDLQRLRLLLRLGGAASAGGGRGGGDGGGAVEQELAEALNGDNSTDNFCLSYTYKL